MNKKRKTISRVEHERQIQVAFNDGHEVGYKKAREESKNNIQNARFEAATKLLSTAGQYQEAITRLLMAENKML